MDGNLSLCYLGLCKHERGVEEISLFSHNGFTTHVESYERGMVERGD